MEIRFHLSATGRRTTEVGYILHDYAV